MKKTYALALLGLGQILSVNCQISAPTVTNPLYKPGWEIVFSDEFNDPSLSQWDKIHNANGSNPNTSDKYERAFYKSGPDNLEVSNGTLKIKCIEENYTGIWYENWEEGVLDSFDYQYTTGMLRTKQNYHYGYYEVRCKMPVGNRFSSAFWLFSGGPWNEIDFYENKHFNGEHHIGTNYHVYNPNHDPNNPDDPNDPCSKITKDSEHIAVTGNVTEEFYTIGVDWTPEGMTWYVNNQFARQVNNPVCGLPVVNPGKVILNLSIVGYSGLATEGYLDDMVALNQFPGVFEVDYVRIYKKSCEFQESIEEYGHLQGYNNQNERPRLTGDFNGDGRADVVAFAWKYALLSYGQSDGTLGTPIYSFHDYTKEQGYTNQEKYPRLIGDINGDGKDDIVAFGKNWTSFRLGNGTGFDSKQNAFQDFTKEQGYTNQNERPRMLGDVNGDGYLDIIAFGTTWTKVALWNSTTNQFNSPFNAIKFYTKEQDFVNQDLRTRKLGDVNGDGKIDIIAFGWKYVRVSLGLGNGTFGPSSYALEDYTLEQGWNSMEERPRLIGDVNGDDRADIVAFGYKYVTVSLGKANGGFSPVDYVLEHYTKEQAWIDMDTYPRMLADVNGDCKEDIIGFGDNYTQIAISKSTPTAASFHSYQNVLDNFAQQQGWASLNKSPRMICDIDGDFNNDIIGFGYNKVYAYRCLNQTEDICENKTKHEQTKEEPNSGLRGIMANPTERFTVYPNPSQGVIHVSGLDVSKYNRIDIINHLGQTVNTITDLSATLELCIEDKGIYIVRISGSDHVKQEKVVIQ